MILKTEDHDPLAYAWLSSIEASDHPRSALWAFFQWGETCLYDIFDDLDNPAFVQAAETCYMGLMDALPEWKLWQQYGRICYAHEPPAPDLALPQRRPDSRVFTDLEPAPDHTWGH